MSGLQHSCPPFSLVVVVRLEPSGQHTAQIAGLPEIQATASTREEAIQQVRNLLNQGLASGQLVPIEVPEENPWLQWFGWAKNDPDFDLYREEIRRFRQEEADKHFQEMDERACSDSSSTPTT